MEDPNSLKGILQAIHLETAKALLARVMSGEATAAEFGQAIKLLQHNGVDLAATGDDALSELAKAVVGSLPFTDPEDSTHLYN